MFIVCLHRLLSVYHIPRHLSALQVSYRARKSRLAARPTNSTIYTERREARLPARLGQARPGPARLGTALRGIFFEADTLTRGARGGATPRHGPSMYGDEI